MDHQSFISQIPNTATLKGIEKRRFLNGCEFFDATQLQLDPKVSRIRATTANLVREAVENVEKKKARIIMRALREWYGSEYAGRACIDLSRPGYTTVRDIKNGAAIVTFYPPFWDSLHYSEMRRITVNYRMGPPPPLEEKE